LSGSREVYSWQAHPARERAGQAVAAGLMVVCLSFLSAALMQHTLWGVIAVAILAIALNRFFFPSRFTIDEEGITARYPLRSQRFRWADLRRFAHDEDGGYLSTRARPSRLDAWRGMHLLFGGEREEAVRRIEAHLPEEAVQWAR
jgi:hypothetical protein